MLFVGCLWSSHRFATIQVSCPLFASVCLAAACCTMTLPEGAADVNDGNDEKAQLSKGNSESSELALVNEETQLFTDVVA